MELPGCFSLDLSPGEATETPGGDGFGHAE